MPAGTEAQQLFYREITNAFPWLNDIGLSPTWLQDVIASSASEDELVAQIRGTEAYRKRFPGLYDDQGRIRMTEAQYIQTEKDYRSVLQQFGYGDDYRDASQLVGFFQSGQDPNELRARLQVYRDLDEGGQAIKDAFYVYSGRVLSTEDLFQAVVDPAKAQNLANDYNKQVANSKIDYQTWITRATQAGLNRVADVLTKASQRGEVLGTAVQQVLQVNPDFARQIMDVLYTGGGTDGIQSLGLEELLQSFEFAAVGAAASRAGLELPSKDRLQEIRAAGVDKAKMIEGYQNFGLKSKQYAAAVLRARGQNFSQTDFESAAFLGDAGSSTLLEAGLASEEAAGKQSGTFGFARSDAGSFVQQGFDRRW